MPYIQQDFLDTISGQQITAYCEQPNHNHNYSIQFAKDVKKDLKADGWHVPITGKNYKSEQSTPPDKGVKYKCNKISKKKYEFVKG